MIENRDIVVVGLQPWDTEIGSNCRDVAIEFSRKNRVLYVNYPLDRATYWKNKQDPKVVRRMNVIRGKEDGLVQIGEKFWNLFPDVMAESINWIRNDALFTWLNKRNGKSYAGAIRKALARLGFRNVILFNDNDILRSFYLKEHLQPKTSIYYYRDFILGVDYWKVHGEKLEPLLIAKSDICCTNSYHFRDHCRKFNLRSYYVGQGCDLALFTDKGGIPVAPEMRSFRKPVIGYVGALQSLRLDLAILEHIATTRPEWNVVLVGPEDDVFKASRLHLHPNIHFLGSKPPDTLPQFIKVFDVCLNPQLINEVTIGNYPRKIDEYLAMGKPVVATKTEFMKAIFEGYTYLGTTPEDYVRLIEQALHEDSPQKQGERKQCAAQHSWEAHVNEIYRHISDFEKGNPC
ncbi:glycosyltransferase [Sediminibacterium soli]|uniref:glycosyltransferase n=1 Tax=Sediminibacterium soli TaxID=2698829 RepID=UPI001379485C|nr:glycosyltransferase [Sediminibacterium soli]NCI45554.1 glycosyltransferase [Sediminibacterium soli]